MNTQPTDAHRKLLSDLFSPLFYRNRDQALQLIANSEARAVDGAMRDTPWAANYIDMERELTRLRAELANQKVQNNHNWQFQEISEEALKRAEKAEAECLEQARLLGMSGEREADLLGKLGRLESELAAIKHGHGELGKYEQLRLKNAELQRDKARLDWLAVSDTWFDYPATELFNPETFRDAIDAAMKGTP